MLLIKSSERAPIVNVHAQINEKSNQFGYFFKRKLSIPEMATATARAIRPDRYRDTASLLPTLPIDIRIGLFTSLPAEVGTQAGIPYPYCFCQRSSNTHCAGRTCQRQNQSLPKCFIPLFRGRVSLPTAKRGTSQPGVNEEDWITKAKLL